MPIGLEKDRLVSICFNRPLDGSDRFDFVVLRPGVGRGSFGMMGFLLDICDYGYTPMRAFAILSIVSMPALGAFMANMTLEAIPTT
jgi:hypothetical protein